LSTALSAFDETTASGQQLRASLVSSIVQVAELSTTQVSIASISAASRRTGVVVVLQITGSPSSNMDSLMADTGANGFGALFVADAAANGITVDQPL